jgi:hypothetical protein
MVTYIMLALAAAFIGTTALVIRQKALAHREQYREDVALNDLALRTADHPRPLAQAVAERHRMIIKQRKVANKRPTHSYTLRHI